MLWGGSALAKLKLIDTTKHKVIISSHPSPLSVTSKIKNHDSFENTNHFGICNEYLSSKNKDEIDWSLFISKSTKAI